MKRKIALLLAFVMAFSLAPIAQNSVEVDAMVIQGVAPTIPAPDEDGLIVARDRGAFAAAASFPEAVAAGSDAHLRSMQFLPQDYHSSSVVGAMHGWHLHVARFTVSGLNGDGAAQRGGLIPDFQSNANWVGNGNIDDILDDLSPWFDLLPVTGVALDDEIRILQADLAGIQGGSGAAVPDARRNELLSFHSNTEGSIVAFSMRDGIARNAGLVVVATSGASIGDSGANLPISYLAFGENNINLNVTPLHGNFRSLSNERLATPQADLFEVRVDGTPTAFNTRTYLRPIDIAETVAGQFTDDGVYHIQLTLDSGFRWDGRHGPTRTFADRTIRIRSVLGAVSGFGAPTVGHNNNLDVELESVGRDARRMVTGTFQIPGAPSQFPDSLRIGQAAMDMGANDGPLIVQATDGARPGPVRVQVELFRDGDRVVNSTVTAAYFADSAVIFERYEDHDLEDFVLRSGAREWSTTQTALQAAGIQNLVSAIAQGDIDEEYHRTATVILTETVRGTLPFTGLRDIEFVFPEGVQVLAIDWETNDGNFREDINEAEGREYFYDGRLRDANSDGDSGMEILIQRNRVAMRPEIGLEDGREEVAEIRAHFYLSVMPGFEFAGFGNTIAVEARGPGFPEGLTAEIALVQDPITVQTNPVTVGDGDVVAAGMHRHVNIGDIVVRETEVGELEFARQVMLFVEDNTLLDTVAANAIIIRSFDVRTDGVSGLEVTAPRNHARGVAVEVTRPSGGNTPGYIVFSNVQITGLVLPGHEYSITVVGDSVADNHTTFGGAWGGVANIVQHGMWTDEPYLTHAFAFDGTDYLNPENILPEITTPDVPTQLPVGLPPRTLFQNQPFTIQSGPQAGQTIFPSFEMVTFGDGENASAFLAAAAVGDILGWTNSWDAASQQGTFNTPDGRTIVFTNGSNAVSVNGQQMFMTNADGSPANAYISAANDRFMVHIRFFQQLGVGITWLGGTPGNNSLIVTP